MMIMKISIYNVLTSMRGGGGGEEISARVLMDLLGKVVTAMQGGHWLNTKATKL